MHWAHDDATFMQWVCNRAPKRGCLIDFQIFAPWELGVFPLCHLLTFLAATLAGTNNFPFIHSFRLSAKYSKTFLLKC